MVPRPDYGYEEPDNWYMLKPEYAVCGNGKQQSPVNVMVNYSSEVKPPVIDHKLSVFKFGSDAFNFHFNCADFCPCGSMVAYGTNYSLHSLHMHSPSENTLAGVRYPLEAHLVHRSSYGSLAVLGVLFEVGEPSEELEHLLRAASNKHYAVMNLTKLTQVADADGCAFDGSLTTPPCLESVHWFLSLRVMTASYRQIGQFRELCSETKNSRPLQPLNGRAMMCYKRKLSKDFDAHV